MRRIGKTGRRKVFPKVKNVNVESLKIRSKLLDFFWWRAGVTSRLVGVTYGLSVRPHQRRVRLRAAAPAAIFAGVQPSRLTLRELTLSGGVAPGYSQYSLPGWIVLLAVNLDTLKCRRRRIVDLKKR